MSEGENVRKSLPMTVLLAVLALLGIRSFAPDTAAPSGEPRKAKEEHRASEPLDECTDAAKGADRFWRPLKEFRDAGAASDLVAQMPNDLPDIDGWDTRCLIACVPDPIDSSSGYRFDGLIDAIQRATETQGYVEDRYHYPWPRRNEPDKDRSLCRGGASNQSEWHRQPGVLLLRDASRARLLVVFLVGETATAGIHKEAFAASLHLIAKSGEYGCTSTVRILGPYFSGSQTSLERAIQAWGECKRKLGEPMPKFNVISGSATSIDKKRLEHCCDRACVTFQATVAPERDVFAALAEHLDLGFFMDGHFHCTREFAILYESNTTFGQRPASALRWNENSREPDARRPTLFPFPLHISEVHDAYSKTTNGSNGDTLRLPSFGSKLNLPVEDGRHSDDVEPSLYAKTTAVISERLLAQMLETISHERFRYVFIQSSDVKDKLFLAHLVRQQCPECRLVFTDSDVLFSHPNFSADLRGSIVGSTYPLYARNQRWSFAFQGNKARFFFPGPGEQGCYNAVITLLNPKDSGHLLEYGPPFAKLDPQTIDQQRPPVWISIVGQDGLYPLKAIPASKADKEKDRYGDYVYSAPSKVDQQPKAVFVPAPSNLLFAVVLGMVLYVGWSYYSVLDWPWRRARKHGTAMQVLFQSCSRQLRGPRMFYALVWLISLLIVAYYLAFVCLLPLGNRLVNQDNSPVSLREGKEILLAILAMCLLIFPVLLLFRAWRIAEPRLLRRYRCYLALALLLAFMAGLLFLWSAPPQGWLSGQGLLFAERAADLVSGVSPVVPILLIGAAFFSWSQGQLKRLYLLAAHAVKEPFPSGQPLFQQVDRWHGEAISDLRRPIRALREKGVVLVWAVLLFAFWRLFNCFVPADAARVFLEGFILVGLAVLATMIVANWLHLRKLWGSMRHLLNAIALLPQPLREAFEHIPPAVTRMFGPYLSSQRPGRQEQLSYRQEQRALLVKEYAQIAGSLNEIIPLTGEEKNEMAWNLSPSKTGCCDPAMLTGSARACLLALQHVWHDPSLQAHTNAVPKISRWLTRATDFAALELMVYLSQFFVQLRNLIGFLVFAPLLMLLAASSYPFQPQRLWLYLSVALIGLATATAISIILQIERNGLLSRILNTTPNQFDFHWSFLSHLLLNIVPLLGVLMVMSSDVSNLVHSWLDPLLHVLK